MGIIVINTKPYKEQPVPEVGKEYHIFDDGKISYGRHYMAKIEKVIPFGDVYDQESELYLAWKDNVKEAYWLFAEHTDFFIQAKSNYDENPLFFVRTTDGGWFSIDFPNSWMGARLDITGELYEDFKQSYIERKQN